MKPHDLPRNTWLVVERRPAGGPALVSQHATCGEAEAERDRRNRDADAVCFQACIVLEPVAQRMGGRQSPASLKR